MNYHRILALIFSRPGRGQGLLYKQPHDSIIKWVSLFLPQLYGVATAKQLEIDYVKLIKTFLNLKVHHNRITGSKSLAFFSGWGVLCLLVEGLRLQPAQQACSINIKWILPHPKEKHHMFLHNHINQEEHKDRNHFCCLYVSNKLLHNVAKLNLVQ